MPRKFGQYDTGHLGNAVLASYVATSLLAQNLMVTICNEPVRVAASLAAVDVGLGSVGWVRIVDDDRGPVGVEVTMAGGRPTREQLALRAGIAVDAKASVLCSY